MSHFGDYMDGVPVKISERYIRPPRIELPHNITESHSRAQHLVDNVKYCTIYEQNVLTKVKELKSAKHRKKIDRRHRLQLLEEAKQRKLDQIAAAEAEEKLKQLSVSEVSYPSTEEISEISPDDKSGENCDTTLTPQPEQDDNTFVPCHTQTEPHLNILQPVQVQSGYASNSLLDDPDPLQEIKLQNRSVNIPHYNSAFAKGNVESLTYKDFENDTSSPFDNVALKTINEMELLAQVLESEKGSNTSCMAQSPYTNQTYATLPNSTPMINDTAYPNNYIDQTIPQTVPMYMHNYPSNGYNGMVPVEAHYLPNYYYPNNQIPINQCYQPISQPTTEPVDYTNNMMYIPQQYYYSYPVPPAPYDPNITTHNPETVNIASTTTNTDVKEAETSPQKTVRSRSRSVPDIVKELNEELERAKLTVNERSYNPSPAPKEVLQPSTSKKTGKKSQEPLPNPFSKLSVNAQGICQKIHGMGFPLDRVARICAIVGENDKKIIEALLIVGEFIDLGFAEPRAVAALVRHAFSRERALDDLVT